MSADRSTEDQFEYLRNGVEVELRRKAEYAYQRRWLDLADAAAMLADQVRGLTYEQARKDWDEATQAPAPGDAESSPDPQETPP